MALILLEIIYEFLFDFAEDDDLPEDVQWCNVVWEGETSQRNFGDMTFKQCTTDVQAKEFFQKHGVEHYWDLCHAQTVLQE